MKTFGVAYDVGLQFAPGDTSVEPFDAAHVEFDMQTIANDLHANAVRIIGQHLDRLETAGRLAHAAGLSAYLVPWKIDIQPDEFEDYIREAAKVAERLRQEGGDVVFVVGCELTIFAAGIFPGAGYMDRIGWFASEMQGGGGSVDAPSAAVLEKSDDLNKLLKHLVATVRSVFRGKVTYAAGGWEAVDWSIFDIVGVDHYRRGESSSDYVERLKRHRQDGKELVVMEFGCCTFTGASQHGDGGGFAAMQGTNPDGTPQWVGGVAPERNETEQADYIAEQLELIAPIADGAFVFIFNFPIYPHTPGPNDLDIASFSLVKHFPADDPRSQQVPAWEPKESFDRLAAGLAALK